MKMQQLQMLKQRADVTMDDGLGQASGAGREHHPKRMIVGNMLVAEVLARHLVVRQQVGPGAQLRPGWRRTRGIEIRQPDHRLQRRQGIHDAAYIRFSAEILPAETINRKTVMEGKSESVRVDSG